MTLWKTYLRNLILIFMMGSPVFICHAGDSPSFNTVRIEGQNFVNLADLIRYYDFDKDWKQDGLNLTLTSKYKKLRLRINSREAYYNGVRLWLNNSPLESRNSILISEIDITKTLDPLLRPWAVPRRKVRTIMLDPGHGGDDNGTPGYRGSYEKRLALDIAKRVESLLKEADFKTLMTRKNDSFVSLEDRSIMANTSDADLFISIHLNSAKPDTGPKGLETYCLTPVGLSSTGDSIRRRLGLRNFGEEPGNSFDRYNILLAHSVQLKMLNMIPGLEDRGVKRARFYVIKATECPAILIESGFLSNPGEEKKILTEEYRQQLAEAIVEGVKRYISLVDPSPRK